MLTIARDQLSNEEAVIIATIETAVPPLVAARDLFDRFQAMVRQRKPADLANWLEDASTSLLASFANGFQADKNAVAAALIEPWSNGQTEGQITKLKLVKRQMYGRTKLDLLRARLLGAGDPIRDLHRRRAIVRKRNTPKTSQAVAPGAHAVVLLDQAGWHTSAKLPIPSNITLMPLPAKSPELNPVESIGQFMRNNWLSNRLFTSYTDILDQGCFAWNCLVDQPWKIISIGSRLWAHVS